VFWWSPKQGPTWVSGGVIHQTDYEVHVETLDGTQTYRLFDHVTVVIQLKRTSLNLHANELAFHLVSRRSRSKAGESSTFGKSEVNFLHELKLSQDRGGKGGESDDEVGPVNDPKKKSVYRFFLDMSNLGASASD
jgi:hypothetical protein